MMELANVNMISQVRHCMKINIAEELSPDISQAFDKVWHCRLRYSQKKIASYFLIVINSCLENSCFEVKFENKSLFYTISAGSFKEET